MSAQAKTCWTQPLTFGGVAAFAQAPVGRLWIFQLVIALLAAGSVIFFFEKAWVPVITRTIELLPNQGQIQNGELEWPAADPVRAPRSGFLQLSVDPSGTAQPGEGADLQIEFGRTALRLHSLFGFLAVPYSAEYLIGLNRPAVEPWWGAWHLPILITIGMAVVVGLFVTWTGLALLYTIPVRLLAFQLNRSISWAGTWRLAAAALLPGALLLTAAISGYAVHQISLVHLIFAVVLHFLFGWVFLVGAPFFLPVAAKVVDLPAARSANPFSRAKPRPANPFQDPAKPAR